MTLAPPRRRQAPTAIVPGPFGLLVLGATVALFSLVEMQVWSWPSREFRLVLLLAGGLLLADGLVELRRRNGLGAMLSLAYGFFWLALSAFFYLPGAAGRVDNPQLFASYVIMWGLFSSVMFVATLQQTYLLRTAMASLAIFQFAIGAALLDGHLILQVVAGGLGLGCGSLFLLLAGRQTLRLLKVRRSRTIDMRLSGNKT